MLAVIALLFLSLTLSYEDASASEFTGFAAFAAMNPRFPCNAYLRSQETAKRPAMAIVWGTFGYSPECVARYLERFRDRPHLLQIHLSNEVCRRNKRCRENEIEPKLTMRQYNQLLDRRDPNIINQLLERLQLIRAFTNTVKNGNTTLILSAGLEDNYSASAFRNLLGLLREEWPGMISRNPLRPSAGRMGADFIEAHLLNYDFQGEPCIATQDGVAGSFAHSAQFILNYHQQCMATILWRNNSQGAGQRVWRAPLKRAFSIREKEVTEIQKLLRFAAALSGAS